MGAYASQGSDRTSLIRGLGASIRDSMRPTPGQIEMVWRAQLQTLEGGRRDGQLGREDVRRMMNELIELQIQDARQEATRVKMDMARQQASLERMARQQRSVVGLDGGGAATKEQVEKAIALQMGSQTGPVMAGMMSGYVDIPVTCLIAMKEDDELLRARVDTIFKSAGVDEALSLEDFTVQYLDFYDNAPKLLVEEEPEDYDCVVQ